MLMLLSSIMKLICINVSYVKLVDYIYYYVMFIRLYFDVISVELGSILTF